MTCENCKLDWCFMCGKKDEDCYKGVNGKTIVDHYKNFEKDEKCCPLFLFAICEVDDRWPENDSECQALFCEVKIISNLRKWVN